MKESIHRYFKMGTIQWMSHPVADYPVLESIKKFAGDDFFDALEVGPFQDEQTRSTAKKLLQQSHMTVCFGAQPVLLTSGLNPNDIDEEGRKAAENALIKAIDEAEFLGAGGIAFLSGHWEEMTREESFKQLVKTTITLCKYAAAKNIQIELEVFDFDMDKKALIGPAPLAKKFAEEVRCYCNNFGLLIDLSHFPTTYETSSFVVETLKPYITHLHIGNAVVKPEAAAFGDLHPRFGFPESANDMPELLDFFQVLYREGFFRKDDPLVLSFEVKPWGDEDGDIVLANTKRVINRAWALLDID